MSKVYYEEAVRDALDYGDKANEYLEANPMPITGRNKELFDRDLAIKEWYEDHGIDSTVYEKFTDCDLEDRERYIWWYEKNENEKSYKDKKMKKLSKALSKMNKMKQKLEKLSKPWLS